MWCAAVFIVAPDRKFLTASLWMLGSLFVVLCHFLMDVTVEFDHNISFVLVLFFSGQKIKLIFTSLMDDSQLNGR